MWNDLNNLNRREFVKSGTAAGLLAFVGGLTSARAAEGNVLFGLLLDRVLASSKSSP